MYLNGDEMINKPQLSEADAAIAFAKAWNSLDPSEFLELLDENACYASMWVLEELTGKAAISEYLIGKMQTFRHETDCDTTIFAELGRTTRSFPERDCVILAQGDKANVVSVAMFEVADGLVQRYDLWIPEILAAERLNGYST